jgi:hypothetical protein
MVGSNLCHALLQADLSSEDAGLDSPVRLAGLNAFQALTRFALCEATFQLFSFVRLQHQETSADQRRSENDFCLNFIIETK